MGRISRVLYGWAAWGLMAAAAHAQATACRDEALFIRSAVGRVVEVQVSDGVGDLVRSGDPATLKVEHVAGRLFVTPLTAAPAQLTVIDREGCSHRLELVFGDGIDHQVRVQGRTIGREAEQGRDVSMDIIRDLVRGRVPAGAVESDAGGKVMFDNGVVQLRCLKAFELPHAVAYVMSVEDLAPHPIIVPLQRIVLTGLVALTSRKDLLAPGERSELYMVVRR